MCAVRVVNRRYISVDKNWTEKADADAAFLPFRPRTKPIVQEVTLIGIYLANC